jgi:glycosyltransferase involved in cell wall biosynthesis
MAHIVFYANETKSNLGSFEYYKQDIDALKALGHTVTVCTRYREIPLHFDAIFIWWWTYALWPVLLSRVLRRASLITGAFNFKFANTLEGKDYFRRPLWQRQLIRWAAKLCSLNLFINEFELRDCSRYFRLTGARFYPCTVHEDYLRGPAKKREKVLFNIAWSGKGNLIRKGVPELLHAIRLLKDEGIHVRANLAGHEGDGVAFLHQTIQDLRIADRVTYLGPLSRSRKIELLRTCEIYVQPSHHEGFGLAIAEAMGCGACVITCDVGSVRSVVGESGIYVMPGSPRGLADALKNALVDDETRIELQRNAAQRAKTEFAPEGKLRRLKQYLAEVGVS